ncbi:putative O-methyltransferase [Cryphonectria parasitica EP155]|uniref:O-methyltransferase n=1 Tax=Cryphonectria parasitica (strain ATCC 38755 / EP155) TaxID=660469 RepID=A0A9P4Y2A0_CRYP1|nr:putative O-methyltransferase [Cryphonectria parasitica EP155]KAF3765301.1 putative O-methyltransferase [Cryphonectria parasitica EP155]
MAQDILSVAIKLDSQLAAASRPPPSLGVDFAEGLPADIEATRADLVDKLHEAKRFGLGSRGTLWEMGFQFTDEMTLRAIYEFRLAHHVPLDSSATFDEVSKASGLSLALTERLIRQAMASHIFTEAPDQPGHVIHTATSRLLATDADAMDAIGMLTEDLSPACNRFDEAVRQWGIGACSGNGEPHHAASAFVHDGAGMFDFLAKHPDRGRRFSAGMRYFGRGSGWDLEHLVKSYPWHDVDVAGATFVDIGGGYGTVSQVLAASTNHIKFLVQDLPHTVKQGAAALPNPLRSRIFFEEHDFLTPQTHKGTDVFFLRWILHNWGDQNALQILRSLIPGMKHGTRVVIYEFVLSNGPETKLSRKQPRNLDLVMLACWNSPERTESMWKELIGRVDTRLKFVGVRGSEGSLMSVIEAVWEDQTETS